jgi:hypothetical protein
MSLIILAAIITGSTLTIYCQKWIADIRNRVSFQINRLKNQFKFLINAILLIIFSAFALMVAAG